MNKKTPGGKIMSGVGRLYFLAVGLLLLTTALPTGATGPSCTAARFLDWKEWIFFGNWLR